VPEPEIPPLHADLDFNAPLSGERADRLIGTLAPLAGCRVLDLGCGWAELLLRAVAADPTATGVGIDSDAAAVAHGLSNAVTRELADRVELTVGDAANYAGGPVDVLLNNGASHVFGGDPLAHTETALVAAHRLLRPGGRLLLGEGFWLRPPTDVELEAMPMSLEEYGSLADLVDLARSHGYRLLALSQATTDEWDDFESRYALGCERWLRDNPDSPRAEDVRASTDAHRTAWLRGYRDTLGYAYLTLLRS
jgi:cyclopropane fatty-acyl-phospholipid synthase-like methyltransferase